MQPRPLGDRVLVKQDPPKTTRGLIHIPDVADFDYPNTGTVLGVGPKNDQGLSAGMRVLFARQPGSALVPDDRDLGARADPMLGMLMLKPENVLAVIEDE